MTAAATPSSTPDDSDWAVRTEAELLAEALSLAPSEGWTWRMTLASGRLAGLTPGETELLVPNGPRDLAALHARACDSAALEALSALDPKALKVRERIRSGVLAWLGAACEHEAATRRWAGFLALPTHAALGLRLAWATADALWIWAGDTATDENHYSKRALLAGILVSTLAVRLADGEAAAEAHLDRGIEGVMRFEKLKAQVGKLRFAETAAGALGSLRFGRL